MKTEVAYRRSDAALTRSFAGEVVLALSDREDVQHLSGTGADVWQVLAEELTLPSLIELLADRYGVDAEAIRDQVESFVSDLVGLGAVVRHGATNEP